MRTTIARLLATTAFGLPLALGTVATAAQTGIGTVAAVNPDMDGTPPGTARRTLTIGTPVIENERVETSLNGSGQLLFLDQTSLTVAPQSDIVLDRYVYDPQTQTGEIGLNMGRGVLRFIGGRITKQTEARVRTPVATVGIRGGLALIIVEDNGDTRICHIAGEYSHVRPADGSDDLVLSRPNACATVSVSGVEYTGLIRAQELAEIYERLEGRGAARATTSRTVDVDGIARLNSAVPGGSQNRPVSTSGESAPRDESPRPPRKELEDDGTLQSVGPLPEPDEEPVVPPPPPPPPPVNPQEPEVIVTGQTGAVLFAGSIETFDEVQLGSLIGVAANGEIVIPVPGTGDSETEFDTPGILDQIGNPGISALDNAELFRFSSADGAESTLPAPPDGTAHGGITGIGLYDEANEFLYAEFISEEFPPPAGGSRPGVVVIGNPNIKQGLFFGKDALLGIQPDGSKIVAIDPTLLQNPDLADGVVNNVEGYRLEPNLVFQPDIVADDLNLLIVGNEGMVRYDSPAVSSPAALTGGGKWLAATLDISERFGVQDSAITVLADDIRTNGAAEGSGPILSAVAVSSDRFGEDEGTRGGFAITNTNVGTIEDGDGGTLFGSDPAAAEGDPGLYLAVSSARRGAGPGGAAASGAFEFDPGSEFELFHQPSADFTIVNDFVLSDFEVDAGVALLTRDESLTERIANPMQLAGARQFGSSEVLVNSLQGIATSFAVCETGQCGEFVGEVEIAGMYRHSGRVNFVFDQVNSQGTEIDNEVDARFSLETSAAGDVEGLAQGDLFLDIENSGDASAVIDDNRFAIGDSQARILNDESPAGNGNLVVASAGLVGDGGIFPAGTDTDPEFLRWGWWSASYDLQQVNPDSTATTPRRDIIHLGNWIAGAPTDAFSDVIPLDITATYDGFAVGTMANLERGTTEVVGGTFSLTYDFLGSASRGSLSLNIPDAGIANTVSVNPVDAAGISYAGSGSQLDANNDFAGFTEVRGQFFTSGGVPGPDGNLLADPIAATAGQFSHTSPNGANLTHGVFGGDKTSANDIDLGS